jgi:hypothetical protein
MGINELKKKLVQYRVPQWAYSLKGGLPKSDHHAIYCLGSAKGRWQTYTTEKGVTESLRLWDTETEACTFFYQWITSDTVIAEEMKKRVRQRR